LEVNKDVNDVLNLALDNKIDDVKEISKLGLVEAVFSENWQSRLGEVMASAVSKKNITAESGAELKRRSVTVAERVIRGQVKEEEKITTQ